MENRRWDWYFRDKNDKEETPMEHSDLETRLRAGAFDETLDRLYGDVRREEARDRCAAVIAGFTKTFESRPEALFSAPGRTELGGNHTDHQHGRVLAAGVDLSLIHI